MHEHGVRYTRISTRISPPSRPDHSGHLRGRSVYSGPLTPSVTSVPPYTSYSTVPTYRPYVRTSPHTVHENTKMQHNTKMFARMSTTKCN